MRSEIEAFNVVAFYDNGYHDYVARNMTAESAVQMAKVWADQAEKGTYPPIVKVIITDSDDLTTFVWELGKGVTFK